MKWPSVNRHTDAGWLWLRVGRLFQIRLSRLMLLVAISAVLLSAWLFNRRYHTRPHQQFKAQDV